MIQELWGRFRVNILPRQQSDEPIGNLSCFSQGTGIARYFGDQPRQLLSGFAFAQRRKAASLFPGIQAKPGESREYAERNSIDLIADRCEQKTIEVGPQWAKGMAQGDRDHQVLGGGKNSIWNGFVRGR